MVELAGEIINLSLYETLAIVPMRTFSAGTYTQRLHTQGNSILSSLFIDTIDPATTVQVNYYDSGAGSEDGERYDLASHDPQSGASFSPNRILITKLHDKPVVEIIVTGGDARIGLYVTVVASFASDLDSALKKDNAIADLLSDKGIPMVTYDEALNRFFILRSEQGVLPVSVSEAGDLVHLAANDVSTPGAAQDLITDTVPVGKTRKMTQVVVCCRSHGSYVVTSDSDIIGSGRTGPANPKDIFTWAPRKSEAAGKLLKVTFTANVESPSSDVEAYLMASDV